MKTFALAAMFAVASIAVTPVFAQNVQEQKYEKKQLKAEEKANKAQAKADKKEYQALSTRQARSAAKAQDKADKLQAKVAAPPQE